MTKDPQERRTLLAIALSLAVFYLYSFFFIPAPPPAPGTPATPTAVPSTAASAVSAPALPAAPAPSSDPETPCFAARAPIPIQSAAVALDPCAGALVTAEFRDVPAPLDVVPWWTWIWRTVSRGGVGAWVPYGDLGGTESLLTDSGRIGFVGRGEIARTHGWAPADGQALASVRARDGLVITQALSPSDLGADVARMVVRIEARDATAGPFWLALDDTFLPVDGVYGTQARVEAHVDGKFRSRLVPADAPPGGDPGTTPAKWIGVGDRYFLVALVPEDPAGVTMRWTVSGDRTGAALIFPESALAAGQAIERAFLVYAGPKEVERLATLGHELDAAADLGFFGFFAKVLLFFMEAFYTVLGNWGGAIVALTFLVRIAFYPLSAKAFRSAKMMQSIQPLLKEVQEKYKDDKEKLGREQMALFQRHGVNPLGGCLPILVQMPVFFALIGALNHAPALFHADFLYVQDLSAPDPYGILPALMAVGMVLQQRMTPMTGMDPQQAAMMKWMPLFFALFMFGLPAGLSLYYTINTVLSIAQQWYNTRSIKVPEIGVPHVAT
jgi:YidC/Oxa1 family membrane protein insertase